jgi:mRNA-degrading endonuclease RelE of RelBE toxin-antitoxin system
VGCWENFSSRYFTRTKKGGFPLIFEIIKEEESRSLLEKRAIASKLKSLNDTLDALIQKKIRIELEIKNVRRKAKNLSKQSKTRLTIEVESFGYSPYELTPTECDFLREQMGQEEYEETVKIDSLIDQFERIERDLQALMLSD